MLVRAKQINSKFPNDKDAGLHKRFRWICFWTNFEYWKMV